MTVTRTTLALVLALSACKTAHDEIPGTYTGDLVSNNQASRMQNKKPDGKGGLVADVTSYSGGRTTTGARVVIRDVGTSHGNPTLSADLNGICSLRFQLLGDGQLASNLEMSTCGCVLEGQRVDGQTTVMGSYRDGALSLDVSVSLRGTGAYAGGCSYTFKGKEPL